MASPDILTLSSTPPRQCSFHTMSSSPLPSPSALCDRKAPMLRTNSRVTPVPQHATASFSSATTLFKKASDDSQGPLKIGEGEFILENGQILKISTSKSKKSTSKDKSSNRKVVKPARKSACKKDQGDAKGVEVKKSRKPRAKNIDKAAVEIEEAKETLKKHRAKKETESHPVKEKAVRRKPRATKADDGKQTKLSKAQVTKASKSKETSNSKVETLIPPADSLDLGLVVAVKRKTDWTPPSANSRVLVTPGSIDVLEDDSGLFESATKAQGFKDLFGSFVYTADDTKSTVRKASDEVVTKKRKLIDMVNTNISEATAAAATKPKASRKKVRTITDLATSVFLEEVEGEEQSELSVPPQPILQYFPFQNPDNEGFKVPTRTRSKSPGKRAAKAKQGSALAPILLSPESAMKQVGDQDYVFGTLSQLAREESPTFLRDLHEAIQASNQIEDDDPFADTHNVPPPTAPFSNRGETLASTKRTLWSAGTRDAGGDLLDVERVDMVDSPAVVKMLASRAVDGSSISLPDPNDGWHDVEEEVKPHAEPPNAERSFKKIGPVEMAIREELLSSPAKSSTQRPALRKAPEASKKTQSSQPARSSMASTTSQIPQKPNYDSYTTAKLAKEIAFYHFKPVKTRNQMIALLEKCWEGKNRVALGILGTNDLSKSPIRASSTVQDPPSSTQPTSPRRPRGRPKKDTAANTTASAEKSKTKAKVCRPKKSEVEEFFELDSDTPLSRSRTPNKIPGKAKKVLDEISDSDTPLTLSPPRRRASQLKSSPLPLKLSTTADDEDVDITTESLQASLFSHITRAVASAPTSKDPSKPNWQEKLLLYDPIVLEDFTLWLNNGALEKVGWDSEVVPKEVKKWCETKSVCCLWKENLRGGTRSRY